MKKYLWSLLALFVLLSCDKDDDDNDRDLNQTDRNFTTKATMANFAEIDAGQLAATKATEMGIRMFGQMMVTDHTTAKAELKNIAMSLGLYAPDSLDAEHVALKNQLMAATGREFDSIYIHSQVKDHQAAIALFELQRMNGDNEQLRDYAEETLPHLQHHLHMADSLANYYQ